MEWVTLHHLDLRHVGQDIKLFQPHAATFHHHHALIAAAIGNYIIEFDAYTGSKMSTIDIGARVVRMSYSPTSAHSIVAILEDCTVRSCDFDSEQTCVLHSPEKKMELMSSDADVHLALTPLEPVVFFGFLRRMSVTVVGTIDGGRAPTKIKTDLKKPIVNLSCHPRLPVLYVAYADGLIRAYNVQTYAVLYTLQLDNTIKLIGASAFAFHPTLEWVFVGDRRGTLLAWDVSTERPIMIGITQVGSQPISSIAWMPMSHFLVTVSKDGTLHVWKTHVIISPNQPPAQATFFEDAAIEPIDVPRILTQHFGESVYPLPKIKGLYAHPKLNLATLVLASVTVGDNRRNKLAYTREARKQLFSVLQSARGSSASILKEKLSSLGSSGVLVDHQLQSQLQEHLRGQSQQTMSDIARKAFLFSHFIEGHAKVTPLSCLPVMTIMDAKHHLKHFPVCQPFNLDINIFKKGSRIVHYPLRAFFVDDVNLMAYNLSSGVESVYKKLYNSIPGNVECHPKSLIYSGKQRLFLVVYEFSGAPSEVVLYWENSDLHFPNSKRSTVKGMDAAFIGPNDSQIAVLDDDRTTLSVFSLPGSRTQDVTENEVADEGQRTDFDKQFKEPLQFLFETDIDRIFSTPTEGTLIFASHDSQIGLAKLTMTYNSSRSSGHYISTKYEGRKSIKLKIGEALLQVQWQKSLRGYVAGVLTTQRVLIISADLDILASSSAKYDNGIPPFRSLLWVGPALLFSTVTAINILGWDSVVRCVLSISMPSAVLVGALNDRLLLANSTEINLRQKRRVQIKNCLVGLLEPLLIGFVTMQQTFKQKLDLSETLYEITSRFDSLRITPRSLEVLSSGPPVCGDLAVSLSQAGPQFTPLLRVVYAVKARRFSTALSALKDEFLRSRDYPRCPPTSQLFHRFRQLGYACIRHAQFDSAKETFEVISDFESLIDMFVCHLNPSAMRRLAQKLEDGGAAPELRRFCERILRVRSAGWTQGIFGNFAAESVVPKGAEWGGGDWEITMPSSAGEAIPRWDLAAEVLPYMRTEDGAVPSVIADDIGVYLGLARGRGGVIEVRDRDAGDSKSRALVPALSASASADEQAKAEAEFKRSMFGDGDGGSSGDEDASKTKKLQITIREKPATSSVVDVSRIKEAARQFKLGDGLGRPPRTRSSSGGSQDIAPVPVDLFSNDPPALAPSGVASVPIPEDFFRDTISSLQAAASLPPAGTFLSKMDNVEVSGAETIGLPDGGVPPQAVVTQIPGAVPGNLLDLSLLGASPEKPPPPRPASPPSSVRPGQVPRGHAASVCFKTGLAHMEQNQLADALSCLDEAFLALAKDYSRGVDIKAQVTICAQYKISVTLLREMGRLQRVQGASAVSAKDEMARLSRHLGSLPLLARHRISCVRTAIKRNMEVQNYGYAKLMLDLLLSKAPPAKQDDLRSLVEVCVQRGLSDISIDPLEDPSRFCAATLSRLSTIGYDVCGLCGAKFSALSAPGCIICGMGSIERSDAVAAPVASPFG